MQVINNTLELPKTILDFDFVDDKITTGAIANYFKKLYHNLFIYQNDYMYNYNGVYWKPEHKSDCTTLNIFLNDKFFYVMIRQLQLFTETKDKSKMKAVDLEIFEEYIKKLERQLKDLQNYDKRIKYVRDIINFLTNDNIKFDTEKYLFAFNNKIFDLKLNQFIEPKSTYYISITCGYDYIEYTKPKQKRKTLNKLFDSVFPNEEIKKFYLTLLSTSLDGQPMEKIIFLTGSGGNGKGMIGEFFMYILGKSYGYVLPSNVLTGNLKQGANTEIGNMNNKRFVIAREPDSELTLNCSTLKEITGGNEINSRIIYSKQTTVNLCLTFFIECNDKPILNEVNDALKRRLIEIPFTQKFVDKEEYDELENKKNVGIVNDKFKGDKFKEKYKLVFFDILREYYKAFHDSERKLILPEEVKKLNNKYMMSSDGLYQWINEIYSYTDDNKASIKIKNIFSNFKMSNYYKDLKKSSKKNILYKDFVEKLQQNLFLKKYVKTNKDNVLCLYSYSPTKDDSDSESDNDDFLD